MLYDPFAPQPSNTYAKCVETQLGGFALDLVSVTGVAARLKAIDALGSLAITGVDFQIPGVRVTTDMMRDVLAHILKRNIGVAQWGPDIPGYIPGAKAKYDPDLDLLAIPLDNSRESVGAIYHEAIHAAQDITGDWMLTVLQSESAAYIGECVFLLKTQSVIHRTFSTGSSDVGRIYEAAWDLARKILGCDPHFPDAPPQTTLTDADLAKVHEAIVNVYSGTANGAGMNGIKIRCGTDPAAAPIQGRIRSLK